VVGKIFGWNVHPAPLTRNAETGSLVAHVRLTTRVKCSLKDADAMVSSSDVNSWPLVATPAVWTKGEHVTQVLQQLDMNSLVLVTNIPGKVHFRYLHLVWRRARRVKTVNVRLFMLLQLVTPKPTRKLERPRLTSSGYTRAAFAFDTRR
ncbi:hypothetical protein L915_08964, partial [Phytophthora nicotianae]